MGFIVSKEGWVTIDHSINDFGNTRTEDNPTYAKTRCVERPVDVYSVFLRNKTLTKAPGDNCPFIYGLKRKQELKVGYGAVKKMLPSLSIILEKFAKQQSGQEKHYDMILPMPSSHKISTILAKRVSMQFDNSKVQSTAFRKANGQDIEAQIASLDLERGVRQNIMNAINIADRENKPFSLSDVLVSNRSHLAPLIQQESIIGAKRVLLVDDLYATGQTVITAKNLIIKDNPSVKIDVLCLFSPLNGRIRPVRTRHKKKKH